MIARFATRLFLGLMALLLAAPLAVVSINEKKSLTFPPQGFSLAWYARWSRRRRRWGRTNAPSCAPSCCR